MPCAASAQPVLASHSAPSLTVFLCGGEGGIPSARSGSRTVSRRATCPGASIQREWGCVEECVTVSQHLVGLASEQGKGLRGWGREGCLCGCGCIWAPANTAGQWGLVSPGASYWRDSHYISICISHGWTFIMHYQRGEQDLAVCAVCAGLGVTVGVALRGQPRVCLRICVHGSCACVGDPHSALLLAGPGDMQQQPPHLCWAAGFGNLKPVW